MRVTHLCSCWCSRRRLDASRRPASNLRPLVLGEAESSWRKTSVRYAMTIPGNAAARPTSSDNSITSCRADHGGSRRQSDVPLMRSGVPESSEQWPAVSGRGSSGEVMTCAGGSSIAWPSRRSAAQGLAVCPPFAIKLAMRREETGRARGAGQDIRDGQARSLSQLSERARQRKARHHNAGTGGPAWRAARRGRRSGLASPVSVQRQSGFNEYASGGPTRSR